MTQRLPIPGQDDDTWGNVLNGFLGVSHNSDGTLQPSAITAAGGYSKPSTGIPSTDLATGAQTDLNLAASSLQLGGDIGGTSNAPLVTKINGMAITGMPSSNQNLSVTSSGTLQWIRSDFNVQAFGAKGDGSTDDTGAIQAALTAAGAAKGTVYFPAASGGCYRTTGVSVPGGVVALIGEAELFRSNAPTSYYLNGAVLAPLNSSTTALLTIGSNGSGSVVNTNPHGLRVEGLGFLGTIPSGACSAGMWAVVVTDTSDVTFLNCRDLYCDSVLSGGPTGGAGTGGFVHILSSGSGNGFSENARILFCQSYAPGNFIFSDGAVAGAGGSTDGRVVSCQVNSHNRGVTIGGIANTGGWAVLEGHFSSTNALSHVNFAAVSSSNSAWTLRVESCYFDVLSGTHLISSSRGLQAVGNYFRGGTGTKAISFGGGLSHTGRDPAAVVIGNTFDLNGSTTVTCFAQMLGFTAANFATNGGGEFRNNLVHNHGAAMPSSWVGQFIGSDSAVISNTTSATLDLSQGPVLSA